MRKIFFDPAGDVNWIFHPLPRFLKWEIRAEPKPCITPREANEAYERDRRERQNRGNYSFWPWLERQAERTPHRGTAIYSPKLRGKK